EERPEELIAIVAPHRIGARADGVAHRVGTLRSVTAAAASAWRLRAAGRLIGRRGRGRRRQEQRRSRTRLVGDADRTDVGAAAGLPFTRLIGPWRRAREERHEDQPAVGDLVVSHDGIAALARLARSAEALEEVVGVDGAVEGLAR